MKYIHILTFWGNNDYIVIGYNSHNKILTSKQFFDVSDAIEKESNITNWVTLINHTTLLNLWETNTPQWSENE